MGAIRIDGTSLTCVDLEAVATRSRSVELADDGDDRAAAAHRTAVEVAARRPVYGRTTGVGANRTVSVDDDEAGHGARLLRSHAGGVGAPLPRAVVRAMLAVRLNQLAAGGAGLSPGLLRVIVDALERDTLPVVHRFGAVGTGDLTALAATALTIAGERPWDAEQLPPVEVTTADALAFLSSNAATLAEAGLAQQQLHRLSRAALVVAALSCLAVDGNLEAFAPQVARVTPQPGAAEAARSMRTLLGHGAQTPARIQDPFALRTIPQVHGPALDALSHLAGVVEGYLNTASENPLVDVGGNDVVHHGGFHTAYLALALDGARLAVAQAAALGLARLSLLTDPRLTGLTPFLSAGPAGSSGVLILEYTAASALGRLRVLASPVSQQTVPLSLGTEEDASFSPLAAQLAGEMAEPYRVVVGCELVAAVRALGLRGLRPTGPVLAAAFDLANSVLNPGTEDRDLSADVEAASAVLADLPDV